MGRLSFRQLAYHRANIPLVHMSWDLRWNAVNFLFNAKNIWTHADKEFFLQNMASMTLEKTENWYPYQYTSLGYTFLGWLLGQTEEEKNYEELLQRKILRPFGLKDTVFDLDEEQKSRLAQGYSGDFPPFMVRGAKIDPWLIHPGTRGGGGLYSSMNDSDNIGIHLLKKCVREESDQPVLASNHSNN